MAVPASQLPYLKRSIASITLVCCFHHFFLPPPLHPTCEVIYYHSTDFLLAAVARVEPRRQLLLLNFSTHTPAFTRLFSHFLVIPHSSPLNAVPTQQCNHGYHHSCARVRPLRGTPLRSHYIRRGEGEGISTIIIIISPSAASVFGRATTQSN